MKKIWLLLVLVVGILTIPFLNQSTGLIIEPGTYFEVVEDENVFTNYSYGWETTEELNNWTLNFWNIGGLGEWSNATRSSDEAESGSWSLKFVTKLGKYQPARHNLSFLGKDTINLSYWVYPESNAQLFTHDLRIYYWNGSNEITITTTDLQAIEDTWTHLYTNFSLDAYGITSDSYVEFNSYATSDDPEEEGTMYLDGVSISVFDLELLENYTVAYPMNFSQVVVNESWIAFNNTGFNTTSLSDVYITLSYLNPDPLTVLPNTYILNFSVNASNLVEFYIDGFLLNHNYNIYRDEVLLIQNRTNATGVLYFNNSEWSEVNFSIESLEASVSPTVITNASTGIEETNATLHGYLEDDGDESCIVRFEFGNTTSYGNTTINQTETSGNSFNNMTGNILYMGQLYHYRAIANNTNGTAYGSDMMFLTKPNVTASGYANRTNVIDINVSWTNGTGTNTTYLERNTSSSWERGNGTLLYNGTGTYYFDNSTGENPLSQDTTYYYRLWSYANWTWNATVNFTQWSDSSLLLSNTTYHVESPYNGNGDYNYPYLNITWTRSNNSDQELVVSRNDTYATSWNQSGNWLRQNSTFTYFNETETQVRYYSIFSYNSTDQIYSSGLDIANILYYVSVGCFNESNMSEFITFDIEITNANATQSYILEDISSWIFINVSDIPYGDDTIFIFDSDGYRQRTYYYDIELDHLYNITAYLPLIEIPSGSEGEGEGEEDCQLLLYYDSISVTNPAVDTTINLTHELEEILAVDIYNESLYVTYGGWIEVPNNKFTYNATHVVVNESVLDVNTTMARATYYYEHCGAINSILCMITVEDEYDQEVSNAKCTTQRLNDETEEYVNVSIDLTDSNGQFTIWLIPNVNYRFVCEKENYVQEGNKFWTPTSLEYFKTFRLTYEITEIEPATPGNILRAWLYENNTIRVQYNDKYDETLNTYFRIYENYNATLTYLDEYNDTTNSSFYFWKNVVNATRMHTVSLWLNHSSFGYVQRFTINVYPVHPTADKVSGDWFENQWAATMGSWEYGYTNMVLIYIPSVVFLIALAAIGHPGLGVVICSSYLSMVSWYVWLPNEAKILTLAAIGIIIGFITIIKRQGRKLTSGED